MVVNGRRPSSLKHENCMNNKIALQEGNKANGVGVGVTGGRRKGKGEPRGDEAVGKAIELRTTGFAVKLMSVLRARYTFHGV